MNTINTTTNLSMAPELEDARSAIKALGHALMDYKKSTDDTIRTMKMQPEEDALPIAASNNLVDYVTKGHSDARFPIVGGYSVIPQISLINDVMQTSSLMQMARKIRHEAGTEHTLVEIPAKAFVNLHESDEMQLVEILKTTLKLYAIEFGVFLESELIATNVPSNFSSVINGYLRERFANAENDLLISNDGVAGQVQGIGKLIGEDYVKMTLRYEDVPARLCDMLLQMMSQLPPEYLGNAIWLMSPRTWAAILAMRDSIGQFIHDANSTSTLFGKEVYCHTKFDETHNDIILCNLQEGYTFIEHPNILTMHDKYSDRRGVRNYFKKLIAGSVTNKRAWVSLKIEDMPKDASIRFCK